MKIENNLTKKENEILVAEEWIKKSIGVLDHSIKLTLRDTDKWMSELRKISKKEKLDEEDIRTVKIYSENLNDIYNFETTGKIIPIYLKQLEKAKK